MSKKFKFLFVNITFVDILCRDLCVLITVSQFVGQSLAKSSENRTELTNHFFRCVFSQFPKHMELVYSTFRFFLLDLLITL